MGLERAMGELDHYTGNVWIHILSLKRADRDKAAVELERPTMQCGAHAQYLMGQLHRGGPLEGKILAHPSGKAGLAGGAVHSGQAASDRTGGWPGRGSVNQHPSETSMHSSLWITSTTVTSPMFSCPSQSYSTT